MVKAFYKLVHYLLGGILVLMIVGSNTYGKRELMLVISYLIFLINSHSFYNKRRKVTIGYLFYLLVCFISFNLAGYHFIYNKHIKSLNQKIVTVPLEDHYDLYFFAFLVVSFFIYMYLKLSKPRVYNCRVVLPIVSLRRVLILNLISVISLILFFAIGLSSFILLIPLFAYYAIGLISNSKARFKKRNIFSYCYIIFILLLFAKHRYILLQFIFPVVMYFIWSFQDSKYSKKKLYKISLVFFIGVFIALSYGVLSEFLKLNTRFASNYKLSDVVEVFTNTDLLSYWFSRQIYRVFTIWTHLGGNIIEYVDKYGFFYGATYLKNFAPILGINYVNLPILSAKLISASYAQPGLLAEGYANFGFLGAVLNILLVFYLIEIIYKTLIKKNTILYFILILVPFTQVLIDGGTFYSVIALIIIAYITLQPIKNEKNITYEQ